MKLPNGGKVRISPTIRLLSIISLSIFPNVTLSCVDTQLYGSFDRTHIYQLLKSVIFTQPLCLRSRNSSDFCKVVASKRVSDFLVGIIGDDALLPEQLKVVNDQLTLTLGQIYEDTGIRGSTTRSAQQKGIQQIVFFESKILQKDPERYFKELVGKLGFGGVGDIRTVFSKFINPENDGCLSFNVISEAGVVKVSSTWIKDDLEPIELRDCLVKGSVGIMGIESEGITFNPAESLSGPASIPTDYRIILNLRYDKKLFTVSGNYLDVEKIIENYLNMCGQ